jgi:prepilin-type N-terminal cleavage/methylation domain-containing protein
MDTIIMKTDDGQNSGFTLIEALLSSVVIAVCVMAVSAAFYGGTQNLRDEARILEIVSHAEGKMDELISTEFAGVVSGSDTVAVQKDTVTIEWSATSYDVDGDAVPESDVKLIVVTIEDVELSTLLVDSAGQVTCKI